MSQKQPKKILRPPQSQASQPGKQTKMVPKPISVPKGYQGSAKLKGKTAIVTGGDSGIGRAVAVLFALEGADVVIAYLNEHEDAQKTKSMVEETGRRCIAINGDIKEHLFCKEVVEKTIAEFQKLDILVNNAAEQHPEDNVLEISFEQFENTFRTNVFGYFYMIKYALNHMKRGGSIINTTSVTAYRGSSHLVDYSATKGAIVSLTRSLAKNLVKLGIRVNGVAPGPIWTPLIPATFTENEVAEFGSNAPMGRAGEPHEVAPSYVFLASEDASYMTGQVLHPNGGEIVNG